MEEKSTYKGVKLVLQLFVFKESSRLEGGDPQRAKKRKGNPIDHKAAIFNLLSKL